MAAAPLVLANYPTRETEEEKMEMFVILGCLLGFVTGAAVVLAAQRFVVGVTFRQQRQASKAQARLRVILQNVEAYDGTGTGQKELPK